MTIVEPSDVMGGEPRLEGRRISVLQIAVPVTEGHEPEYVAEQLDITLGEVDEALDYFDNNPKQMAALREKHDEFEAALADLSAQTREARS